MVLQDDLVDACQAGDDVTVTGVIRRRWGSCVREERCDVQLYVEVIGLHVRNDSKSEVLMTGDFIYIYIYFHPFFLCVDIRPMTQ